MISWISIALGVLKLSSAIIQYFNQQELIDAGAAKQALDALEKAHEAVSKGRAARTSSVAESELHPERMRDDDGFKRKD